MKITRTIEVHGLTVRVPSHLSYLQWSEAMASSPSLTSQFEASLALLEGALPEDVDLDELPTKLVLDIAAAAAMHRMSGDLPKKPDDTQRSSQRTTAESAPTE